MRTPYKVIYFCDAVFLGGAEAYLKLLVRKYPTTSTSLEWRFLPFRRWLRWPGF